MVWGGREGARPEEERLQRTVWQPCGPGRGGAWSRSPACFSLLLSMPLPPWHHCACAPCLPACLAPRSISVDDMRVEEMTAAHYLAFKEKLVPMETGVYWQSAVPMLGFPSIHAADGPPPAAMWLRRCCASRRAGALLPATAFCRGDGGYVPCPCVANTFCGWEPCMPLSSVLPVWHLLFRQPTALPAHPFRCCALPWLCLASARAPACRHADRHGYDPFVLELDLKPFSAHQPKISLQVGMRVFAFRRLPAGAYPPSVLHSVPRSRPDCRVTSATASHS